MQLVNPFSAKLFCPKCCLLLTSAAYIQVLFRLDFYHDRGSTDQTDPEGAILFRYFAIFDTLEHNQTKNTKQKCLTGGKMGKFVYMYLACPTYPLKGSKLSTLNLAWVQSSKLWQYFLSYANTLKKEIKQYNIKCVGSPSLISIIFLPRNGTIKKRKNDQTKTQAI